MEFNLSAVFQIGGTTLHSFAGIGTGQAVISQVLSWLKLMLMMVFQCEKLAQRTTVKQQWKKCKHLIVDEVLRCINALPCCLKSFVSLPQDLKCKTPDFHGWWGVLQKTWSGGALCQRKWSALWRHPAYTHWRFSSGREFIALFITIQNMQLPPVTKEAKSRRFAFETSAWGRCKLLLICFNFCLTFFLYLFCKVQPAQHQPHSS